MSLREEVEDEKVKESVHLDYKNKRIMATLPLRGREEDFLSSNRERALCVLNQQCRKLIGRDDDRNMILKAFKKMFDKGYMVLLEDLTPEQRAKFEEKLVQYHIPWRIVFNPPLPGQ